MSEKAPESLVEMTREIITQARDEWLITNRETYGDTVERLMSSAREDMILSVLGFEKDRFSQSKRWAIDHCNGRSGQSFVGVEIAAKAKEAVADMLNKALDNWEPSEEILDAIRRDFESTVKRYAQDYAHEAGKNRARKIVDDITANL